MQKRKLFHLLVALIFLAVMFGCSSKNNGGNKFLPSSETVASSWSTYKEAVDNYSKIKPGMDEAGLKQFGIYDGGINIRVLNWLSVYKTLPKYAVQSRKLDKGILDFIDAGDSRVKAFEVYVLSEYRHREGSFFLDILAFKRRTRITGYEFSGLILLVDKKVSYVFRPTGEPIDKVQKEKKPLGLFQGLGSLVPKVIRSGF